MNEFVDAVTSEGRRVLETDLADGRDVAEWIAEARERGVDLLWLHSDDEELAARGFERFPGFTRLRADDPPARAERLAPLSPARYAATLDDAYRGLWGHKAVEPEAEPPPEAIVLGLYEHDEPVGLCTLFPADRLVDGPGVVPRARNPSAYARLLAAACAELGAGHVEVHSWGDDPAVIEAYCALGFTILERTGGWQLDLR